MEREPLLPKIIISDYTITPPIATSYHAIKAFHPQKEDTIFFGQAYKLIKSLLIHPRCQHRRAISAWPCRPCETTFTRAYWTCAALLLDYYADFYAHDSAIMQSIWFYLFDIWQESAALLIDNLVLEVRARERISEADKVQSAAKVRAFLKNVKDTVALVEVVLWGRKQSTKTAAAAHPTQETILYDPRGEVWRPSGEYNTGSWISGIKPWCQFLYNGGPGVVPPPLPCTLARPKTEHDNDKDGQGRVTTTRYIPHPAIALLTAHTHRARSLALAHYTSSTTSSTSSPGETAFRRIKEFDAHAPVFPSPRRPTHTFTSPLTRHTVSYALSNGAPPVQRHVGFADPDLVNERADWNLLDECVAICKGLDAYLGVSGGMGEAEDEDEDEATAAAFDLWTVVERREKEEEEELGLGLGTMFENWCGAGECEVDFVPSRK